MDAKIFDELLPVWKNEEISWNDKLAEKYGYSSGEALRSSFRRERKRRGSIKENKVVKIKSVSLPVIGILDIESLPAEVEVFELFDQNIGVEQVVSEVALLAWAGKFLNEAEVYSDILTSKEAPIKNMERIVKSCHDFMSKCDAIIGHSIVAFDAKMMNTFFLRFDLPPIKYVMIDTLLIARNNFRFSSNKLSFINRTLNIRDKFSNDGFILWRNCHRGNQEALDKMKSYNINDVFATEELFYKLRPYIKNINMALYNEIVENQCPVCGSLDLTSEGFYYTSAGKWESLRCNNCKSLSRKKQNLLSTEKKKSLLINS